MTTQTYQLSLPQGMPGPYVFASPHSGRQYPAALMARSDLDALTIRSSEDAFVDQLFECAPDFGAPLLCANAPRAYVDLNRAMDELDPALIEGVRRSVHNPRVASGLGVVPRVVAHGRTIYRGKIPRDEAEARLNAVWVPYHTQLQALLSHAHDLHGEAILIDCHSMPHEAVKSAARGGAPRAEIVIGDRFGAAAATSVVERVEAAFAGAGLRVARNSPFAGAYTVQNYGRPSRRQHAIQIEIDRSLYLDEARIEPNANFEAMRALLRGVVAEITGQPAQDGVAGLGDQGLAAE